MECRLSIAPPILVNTSSTRWTLLAIGQIVYCLPWQNFKGWLALGIEQLGRDVAGEVESEWMVLLLVE